MCRKNETKYTGGSMDESRQYEPEFAGPIKKRSCTDVFCGLIFFVFILGLAVIAVWSFFMGDYRRLVFPKDSQGSVCGLDFPDKPKLVFFDITSCIRIGPDISKLGCQTPQVCVSKCPNYDWKLGEAADSKETRDLMICHGGVSANDPSFEKKSIEDLIQTGFCAPYVLKSSSVLSRCIPKKIPELVSKFSNTPIPLSNDNNTNFLLSSANLVLESRSIFARILSDLFRTWPFILICLSLAAVVSLIWICLLRCCTAVMVYITLLSFGLLFGGSSAFCFYRYYAIKTAATKSETFYFSWDLSYYFRYANTWLFLGILAAVLFFIVMLILICLRKRIQMAIVVIREASKAVKSMPTILLWPIVPFILIIGVLILAVFVDVNLRSVAIAEGVSFTNVSTEPANKTSREWVKWAIIHNIPCIPETNSTTGKLCHFVKYGGPRYIALLQVYTFAVCIWLLNFIIALGEITLAGTFATFYFSRRDPKRLMPTCPLLASFGRSFFFHFGSLAFGSLLITLLSLLRSLLLYAEKKLKPLDNPIAKFFKSCLCCCFWCLEKFLRFLNRNAYIMISIYGYGFCHAARDAFSLILRNVVRVFVVDKVTDFVLFVGKLVVCGLTGAIAFTYLNGMMGSFSTVLDDDYQPRLNYLILPVGIIIIGSYLIARVFFSVFEMGVDTIFVCFCEDLERNDGSVDKPYFMTSSLMKTLGKSAQGDV